MSADDNVLVGTVTVQCPACDVQLPIPVTAHLSQVNRQQQELVCNPDMSDVWAHAFTHMEHN